MDNRFEKIRKLLTAYSLGKFDKKIALSRHLDEIDAFIAGVNMLGEELNERTISRDYFNNIFNSVSDMVFVLNRNGKIENINAAVTYHLQLDLEFLKGKPISSLLEKREKGWLGGILNDIRSFQSVSHETVFLTKNKVPVPVLLSTSLLLEKDLKTRVLMTAKDISIQKKTQNIILKAIIETEERERTRFARDIHDSIGQQLSAIKFYIGTSADAEKDPRQKKILLKANAALLDVQADLRNICFNLMPKSLETFGLIKAVQELSTKNELLDQLKIRINEPVNFPRLPVQLEFALFRVIQEFINNSLTHSRASMLKMEFTSTKKTVRIRLADNGIGFDPTGLRKQGKGMGLKNVRSRIQSYQGKVDIISHPGKGTKYEILIPIQNSQ